MEDRTGDVVRQQQLLDLAYNVKLYNKETSNIEGPKVEVIFVPEEKDDKWDKVMEETKIGNKLQDIICLETADDVVLVDLDSSSDDKEAEDGKPKAKDRFESVLSDNEDMEDDRELIAELETKITLIKSKVREEHEQIEEDLSTPVSFGKPSELLSASVDAELDGVALDPGVYRQKSSVSGSASQKKTPTTSVENLKKGTTKTNPKTAAAAVHKHTSSKMDTTRKSPRRQRASKKVPSNAERNLNEDIDEEDDDYKNEDKEDDDKEDNDVDVQNRMREKGVEKK